MALTHLRTLIVEPKATAAVAIVDTLRRAGIDPIWQLVEREDAFASALSPHLDVILTDFHANDFDALGVLRLVHERGLDVPVIVVTAGVGDALAVECMKAGAADYLLKERLGQLGAVVDRVVSERRRRAMMKEGDRDAIDQYHRLQEVVRNLTAVVVVLSPDGVVLDVPNVPFDLSPCFPREATGHQFADPRIWTNHEAATAVGAAIARAARGENARCDAECRTPKGRAHVLDLAFKPLRDRDGQVDRILVAGMDITTRLQPAGLASIVNSVDGIVWEADARTFAFTYVSQQAQRILGYPVTNWLTEPTFWRDHLHPDDRERAVRYCHEATRRGTAHEIEYRMLAADGRPVWLRDQVTVVKQHDEPAFLRGLLVDVTAHKGVEARLRESQTMAAIGRVSALVAHDFNNLLTIIQGNAAMLAEGPPDAAEVSVLAVNIQHAGERAAKLTRQLLSVGSRPEIQRVPIDLNAYVTQLSGVVKPALGPGISVQLAFTDRLPAIEADPGMLEQVLFNLMLNARDAMPDGGEIVLGTGTSTLLHEGEGLFVTLAVRDTGHGIDPAHLPHIFEPFYTTKGEGRGSGIGLATVYSIVQQHGGSVIVNTEPGRGTEFRLAFPAIVEPVTEGTTAPQASIAGRETILLVEDESGTPSVVGFVLERYGYTVMTAASGKDALGIWNRHRDRIAVVATDMTLADGMTGRGLAERLLADRPELPIIYMSGYTIDVVSPGRPLVRFLQKPFRAEALASVVRTCLDGPKPESPE